MVTRGSHDHYDLDDDVCVTEIVIQALAAPNEIHFSGKLVCALASRLIDARAEIFRLRLCETVDEMAESDVEKLQAEIDVATALARKYTES